MGSVLDMLNKKAKEWNCDSLLSGAKDKNAPKIPFSSPLMNWATYGGIPRRRLVEFLGAPGSGKSSTAVDICKNAIEVFEQEFNDRCAELREKIAHGDKASISILEDYEEQGPKTVLYVDIEHGFDANWSATLGIDESKILIMQPPDICAEDLLQTIQDLICTGEVGLVVLDSVPTLVTKTELEKKYGEKTVAALAGLMTVFTRKIVSLLTRYDCTMILINQTRPNMDNPYVINSPGGEAIKFYSSLRMLFRLGTPLDFLGNDLPQSAENPDGYTIAVKLLKQKTAPFDRKNASYILMCKSGIRPDFDYAKLAINKFSLIRKGGAWFTVCDPETEQPLEDNGKPVKLNGLSRVYDYLHTNTEYFEKLKQYIEANIKDDASGG